MANLALLGFGKMGQLIAKTARDRGHHVLLTIDSSTDLSQLSFEGVDVAVEFSVPAVAEQLCTFALEAGVPVVSGSTGWEVEPLRQRVLKENLPGYLHATNMSLGVNAVFAASQLLAKLLTKHNGYSITIEETHHIHKLDAPSGTAITLANGITSVNSGYTAWRHVDMEQLEEQGAELAVVSTREGEVFGDHEIVFDSPVDHVRLAHHAKSREGFALGAVLAAEYIIGRRGLHDMRNVLGIH